MIVLFIFCALPCKCVLRSYTSSNLTKLILPKIQESFDPFFHTLPPTSSFLFGATRGLGRVGKGSGRAGDDVCIFLFPSFSFPFVSFFFISFLCLFVSSCNESDISFVPLKSFRGGQLLLLYSEKDLVGNYSIPFCEAHKVAGGNVWSSAWQVNGRRRRVFSVTPQTTR